MSDLISEYLRPKTFADLMMPAPYKERFQKMYDSQNVMNMLFYGKPGSGKTSAARVFCNNEKFEYIQLNGSLMTGIDVIRSRVATFATSVSMFGLPKICFIDEADYMSKNAQASLRGVIEDTQRSCRYIFTANELKKIHSALQSRLTPVCFDMTSSQTDLEIENYINRIVTKMREHLGEVNENRVRTIINQYYPDFRTIANHIEFEFA